MNDWERGRDNHHNIDTCLIQNYTHINFGKGQGTGNHCNMSAKRGCCCYSSPLRPIRSWPHCFHHHSKCHPATEVLNRPGWLSLEQRLLNGLDPGRGNRCSKCPSWVFRCYSSLLHPIHTAHCCLHHHNNLTQNNIFITFLIISCNFLIYHH